MNIQHHPALLELFGSDFIKVIGFVTDTHIFQVPNRRLLLGAQFSHITVFFCVRHLQMFIDLVKIRILHCQNLQKSKLQKAPSVTGIFRGIFKNPMDNIPT